MKTLESYRMKSRARGYTAVEVLSAMTLFAIGAAGVIGMQRVTVQGGEDARRFDMATNIANEWISRLQRDSAFWTEPNQNSLNTINIANTKWLQYVGTCATTWCNPPNAAVPAGMSGSFDTFGRDLPSTSTDATYCAQYRLEWVMPPGTAPQLKPTMLMRAEVRVFFSRLERAPVGDCNSPTPGPDSATGDQSYHFVYATTAIRENPLR